MNWIKVADERPTSDLPYLLLYNDNFGVHLWLGFYCSYRKCFMTTERTYEHYPVEVTHYLILPYPPEHPAINKSLAEKLYHSRNKVMARR